jgi:Protein of unknown function (DUF1616)
MTATHGYVSRLRPVWLSAWPVWAVVFFAALAATRGLPAGYLRAVLALPILLLVPGTLTVCAVFGHKGRPRGTVFMGYAVMLSVVWLGFASLALYVLHILITARSTYWALLVVCAILASVAEARLLRERQANSPVIGNPDFLEERPRTTRNSGPADKTSPYMVVAAAVAGIALLCGGVYFYDHLPHPATVGYTQLAWTQISDQSTIAVGPAGAELSFKVMSQEPTPTHFRLSSEWMGVPGRPLSKPVTFTIEPGRTLTGTLFVPPPPDQCTYRIVVTLVALGEKDPLTGHQPTWSINANVHQLGKSGSAC